MSILAILANGIHFFRPERLTFEVVRDDGSVYLTSDDKAHAEAIASHVPGWRVRTKVSR